MIDNKRLLKLYDDYLPQVLDAVKKYDEENPRLKVPDPIGDIIDKDKLSRLNKDGQPMTMENLNALQDGEALHIDIMEAVVQKILNKLTPEERKQINQYYDYDYEDDGFEYDYAERVTDLIDEALKERELEDLSGELPEFLYRGDVRSDTTLGFSGADEIHPKLPDASKSGKVVFVTSEPSVAASYARKDKFDRIGDLPSNMGEEIYRIRTAGLDPKLFLKDRSSMPSELRFGPQYRYNASIPQERIKIKDQAGNDREVDRIEKIPYISDALTKIIYSPKHLIDAVSRKY